MNEKYIKYMITISSIGLVIGIIPEIIVIYKDPKKVLQISLIYLAIRTLFFITMATALFLKNDPELNMLLILTICYIIYYCYLLFVYNTEYKKKEKD